MRYNIGPGQNVSTTLTVGLQLTSHSLTNSGGFRTKGVGHTPRFRTKRSKTKPTPYITKSVAVPSCTLDRYHDDLQIVQNKHAYRASDSPPAEIYEN